jgi:hypothetical protein
MRIFICILVVAAGGWFLAHRHTEEPAPAAAVQKPAQAQSTATTPQQNSPHNWMKNSLDRAADVKRQAQQQRKENSAAY